MTVSSLQGVTHACFGLSYLVAFLLEVARLVWPRPGAAGAWPAWPSASRGCSRTPSTSSLTSPPPAAPSGSLLLLALGARTLLSLRHCPSPEAGVGRVRAAGRHRPRRAVVCVASVRRYRPRPLTCPPGSAASGSGASFTDAHPARRGRRERRLPGEHHVSRSGPPAAEQGEPRPRGAAVQPRTAGDDEPPGAEPRVPAPHGRVARRHCSSSGRTSATTGCR